jgi:zinc/manganese transport system substrate-binding protein
MVATEPAAVASGDLHQPLKCHLLIRKDLGDMNTRKMTFWVIATVIVAAVIIVATRQQPKTVSNPAAVSSAPRQLQIVAGENFWGSLVSQIGGSHVHVLSVVSDPNADPHEYESNTADARAVADADYVIVNGAGYDSWADKLLGAGVKPERKVLDVADLLGKKEGDNPHFWYDPAYVETVVSRMETDLIALDPADAGDYRKNFATLQASLAEYQGRLVSIKSDFGGTKVAATEDIFSYMADASGLDLVSPPAFTEAVAEGNDPPASSIVTFEQQLKSGEVKVLVYNQQTVTPLTDNIKKLAAENGIPVIGVTETIQPPDASFEEWMNAELISLQNALNSKALGQ